MKNLKCLTLDTLGYFIQKLNVALTLVETNYDLEVEDGTAYSFDIPEYEKGKSIVDIYLNGFKTVENVHYTITDHGNITMKYAISGEGNKLSIVHRKLRW